MISKVAVVCFVLFGFQFSTILFAQDDNLKNTTGAYDIQLVTNSLESSSRKTKSKVLVLVDSTKTIIDISSDEWHGGGIKIKPKQGGWPKKLLVRLHASDGTAAQSLARFSVSSGKHKVVARYGRQKLFPLLVLNAGDKSWTEVKKVRVPILFKQTHMAIEIPDELLETNPKTLTIAWIYMYSLQ